jgi:sugar phosphate isomerase/epimerase
VSETAASPPDGDAVRVPDARVALSTSSAYPEPVEVAFEMAARLGYDGVEIMVFTDAVSQDVDEVRRLSEEYDVPVLSVHSPCLLVTQRVWGTEPWAKLERAREMAEAVGADIVVVHPPFRWQRDYAKGFVEGIGRMSGAGGVRFAVENMYPWRAAGRSAAAYAPGWDPTEEDYRHVTLDLSHTAVSGSDAYDMARALGGRLAHLHLADGSGSGRDEHLVPGRGTQRCADVLELLAQSGFGGTVVVEVSTRRLVSRADREADLAEALVFARLNLASAVERPDSVPGPTP